jgi:hypothetical protein
LTPPSYNRTEDFPEVEGKFNGVGALHDSASWELKAGSARWRDKSDWPHMVRAEGERVVLQDYYEVRDREAECA